MFEARSLANVEEVEDLRLCETLFREVHLVKWGLVQLACN